MRIRSERIKRVGPHTRNDYAHSEKSLMEIVALSSNSTEISWDVTVFKILTAENGTNNICGWIIGRAQARCYEKSRRATYIQISLVII